MTNATLAITGGLQLVPESGSAEIFNYGYSRYKVAMSWGRYPVATGGPDREKIFLILYLSSWVCLRCWDLKKESSRVVLVKMGCNYFQHWEPLGQRMLSSNQRWTLSPLIWIASHPTSGFPIPSLLPFPHPQSTSLPVWPFMYHPVTASHYLSDEHQIPSVVHKALCELDPASLEFHSESWLYHLPGMGLTLGWFTQHL